MSIILTLINRFQNLRIKLITYAVRNQFAEWGNHSYIEPPFISIHGCERITIGDHVFLGKAIQITTWGNGTIHIGSGCVIKANSHITAAKLIQIGDNLLTGTNVLISDNSHGKIELEELNVPPLDRTIYSKGPIKIGNNVWLGNNVCVLANVTIGDGAIIAANSVVTHDIPANCVAAGVPAKIVRKII